MAHLASFSCQQMDPFLTLFPLARKVIFFKKSNDLKYFFKNIYIFYHFIYLPGGLGLVHDAKWSPQGDKFVVSAGTMPAQVTMFNPQGAPIYEFGCSHRNTVSWSPHGRFLCIAGFGNLAGEMDFYDSLRLRKIGSANAHCTVSHGWSPDSRYFLTATLAPRMNVDNGLKIFKYNGGRYIYICI